MTFRESEFPNLVHIIDGVARSYPPAAVSAFIQELVRIYRAIPLYPGLVAMCMGKAFQKWDPKTSKTPPDRGSFVILRLSARGCVAGKLLSWTPAAVQIEFRDPFGKLRRARLPRRRIQAVETFRADTLETLWPTLVFDKKPPAKAVVK